MTKPTDEQVGLYEIDSAYAAEFDKISETVGPAYEEDFARETVLDLNGNPIDGDGNAVVEPEPKPDPEPELEPEPKQEPEPEGGKDGDEPEPDEGEQEDGGDSPSKPDADSRIASLEAEKRLAEHRDRSHRGRLSSMQKRLDELTTALEKKETSSDIKPDDPEFVLPDPEDDEAWDKLVSQYPQLSSQFDARIVARMKAAGPTPTKPEKEGKAAPQQQQLTPEEKTYLVEQEAILKEAYPNYKAIGQDPFFKEFMDTLSPAMQALAQSNDANDVIYLFRDLYTPYYNEFNPQGTKAGGTQDGKSVEGAASASAKAQKALERKQKVLEDTEVKGKQPRFSPGPGLGDDDGDPDSPGKGYVNLFDKIAKEKAKETGR